MVEPTVALRTEIGHAKTMDDMADLIAEARGKQYFDQFRELMAAFVAEERMLMEQRQASNVTQENVAFWSILGGLLIAGLIGVVAALRIGSSIANPIGAITQAMRRLAEGDTNVDVVGAERGDEVGDIAKATQIFKENSIRIHELAEAEKAEHAAAEERQQAMAALQLSIGEVVSSAAKGEFSKRIDAQFGDAELQELAQAVNGLLISVDGGVKETARVVRQMASGDLNHRMEGDFEGAFAELQSNVNETVSRLATLVAEIATTQEVRGYAEDVTQRAHDLSERATEQASSLEQTAATMEEMSASITANAGSSKSASSLTSDTLQSAKTGGEIVEATVSAMTEIEQSASKISDIISVIDGIAFQTNLLALNAAVEAARAGDAGKGFAVVASEVRALAQRSSDASRDIRALIQASTAQVAEGARLVTETGSSLEGIVDAITQVEQAVRDIATASSEQASGVQEISAAINGMDGITQENSSMADESASNAQGLTQSARKLSELITQFKIDGDPEALSDDVWRSAEASTALATHKSAASARSDNWSEY